MTNAKPPVSVIGLGAMGRALAGALLSAGHPTTAWNRTAEKADQVAGARRATTVEEAIAGSELTIVCLLDDSVARDIVEPAAGALDGRVLVNLTSGSPIGARDWEERIVAHGAAYLDGGIIAMPEAIGSAEAFIFYGGEEGVFRRVESTLTALGRPIWLGDDVGLAPGYDMALLSGMYGLYAGAQHAVALVASVGGDASAFTRELLVPWMESMVPFAAGAANPEGYVPDSFNPAMQAVSLTNLLEASDVQGVRQDLTGHLHVSLNLMRRAAGVA
jgi:3-hydroxyisobutyrate dehydrogenase-like beta-hydroxyacid dehydrogenase